MPQTRECSLNGLKRSAPVDDGAARSAAPDGFAPGSRIGVLLPLPLAGVYDYRVGDDQSLVPGDLVEVPIGNRREIGCVWGAGTGEVAAGKLKAVIRRFDCPPVPDVSRRFVDWVANYTVYPPGAVLKMVLPVVDALDTATPQTAYRAADSLPLGLKKTPARTRVLSLVCDGPPMTQADLAREAGVSAGVIKGLAEAGALQTVALRDSPPPGPDVDRDGPTLSGAQAAASAELVAAVEADVFSATLLDGVPGAGKTEVYFEAVCEAVARGRQVLVLLPEIALTAQWLERFKARFGVAPVLWHSELTMAQRRRNWRAIAEGSAQVVAGARSALFLPYPKLGLIVVDEEHESSFKQEEGVTYHARDMAVLRASLSAIPCVLASATPSLETQTNVLDGKYRVLHLPARHGGAAMPDISLIDMRTQGLDASHWISEPLRQSLAEAFANGEQAMLFLNRRGYAPLTLCRACGHRMQCPRCTAWLVAHKHVNRLQCHHCGFSMKQPEACPSCEVEGKLAACGPGVERLAEEAGELFPDARLAIAVSDQLSSPGQAAELVKSIENHDVDLIIGTQIIAKGYHFPLLTLVAAVDADLGLSGGDLRAAERSFQLLYQVAGRAGRAERPGRVLLQTHMPDHPVMQALAAGAEAGGRDRFVEAEAEQRRAAKMPPFGRLAALIVSGRDEARVDQLARDLGRAAPRGDGMMVLGPAPAPMALLRGKHRRRLLIKAEKSLNLSAIVREWRAQVKVPSGIRLAIDMDPVSFL